MSKVDPFRVFLNVPFDDAYEPVFIGLVAALVQLGLRPSTVLEFGGGAKPRIERLLDQLLGCRFSIHDLSRVTPSGHGPRTYPRFNMPFELGLAVAMAHLRSKRSHHAFALLEARPHRVLRTLSDMNGFDALIHGGTQSGAVRCVFELFADHSTADMTAARATARRLSTSCRELKRAQNSRTLFTPVTVNALLVTATRLKVRG